MTHHSPIREVVKPVPTGLGGFASTPPLQACWSLTQDPVAGMGVEPGSGPLSEMQGPLLWHS